MDTGKTPSTLAETASSTKNETTHDMSTVKLSSQDRSSLRTILTFALLTAEAENEDELHTDILDILDRL